MFLPNYVIKIIKQLQDNGYKSWVVGGAVRDSLRGIAPVDYDIATTATPHNVQSMFNKTIPTGMKHGTITVVVDSEFVEVTTLRVEGTYSDGRRPDKVTFTDDIESDLARRDFTINAIAYNLEEGIVDPFDGLIDIENSLIRCVGDAVKRFEEDSLRLIRAIRFATKINGDIDEKTYLAMKKLSHKIENISSERVSSEFLKILCSDNPKKGIEYLNDSGLLKYIIPELAKTVGFNQQNPYHDKSVFQHTLTVVENVSNDLTLRLAALLHDISKPNTFTIDKKGIGHFYGHEKLSSMTAYSILKRLHIPNNTIKQVQLLIKYHMRTYGSYKRSKVKEFINNIGEENLNSLFELMIADKIGKKAPHDFAKIYELKFICEDIINSKEPLKLKDLDINGNDLLAIDINAKKLGSILNGLLTEVIKDPQINKKDILLKKATQIYSRLEK